jgi:acetoin utilization protein AcuB
MPTLATVLTPFPYHIDKRAPITAARDAMQKHDIHHLVVMTEGDIYGLLSIRDIDQHQQLFNSPSDSVLTVEDICTHRTVVADIHDPLDKILDAMAEGHHESVIVLRDGELAGIFTTTDVCAHFSQALKTRFAKVDPPDIIA